MSFIKHENLPELKITQGIRARVVTAETMSVAHVSLDAGAVLPEHAHVNEQVVNVIEGKLEVTVEGTTHLCVPGTSLVLPSNVPHSGKAVTDCRVVDVFHPIREDWVGDKFAGYPGDKNK